MKKKLILLPFLCVAAFAFGQAHIQFETGTWAQALQKAKSENKIIFMDAFTDWCGPCKWMAANVFTDEKVANFYNANFVNVKMDMEKGEGIELAKNYQVNAYPTLLFIKGDGSVHDKVVGGRPAEKFLELGEKVLVPNFESAQDMKIRIVEKGESDPALMRKYIIANYDAGNLSDEVYDMYKPHMQGEKLLEKDHWEVFSRGCTNFRDAEFKYVYANLDRFVKTLPDQKPQEALMNILANNAFSAMFGERYEEADTVLEILEGMNKPMATQAAFSIRAEIEGRKGNWNGYRDIQTELFEKFEKTSDGLNNAAFYLASNTDSKSDLKLCLQWIDESLEFERNYYNLDSKAFILYKLGKKKDAITYMKEAIKVGKLIGDDVSSSEEMLKEWEGK